MKEAWYLHKEMVERGFNLTVSSYNALIRGFLKRKKYVEAESLFEEMRRKGLIPDKEIYNFYLDRSFQEGNMDMALELCDETIEKCLVAEVIE
ncbi:hypothetical protein Nepgr_003510 [Nepenthes gracilis]|uniref:Pentatricopeptide repeat-containing protein n=1 Tax=Nepenthes gracilis TaxID=150966 RepID=A0AAD3RZM6_NEPGR|nr:hypothetical protein Nepgr_003510 [Nepenthes gracilis]